METRSGKQLAKVLLATAMVVVTLAASLALTTSPAEAASQRGRVKTPGSCLRLRAGPTTYSRQMSCIPHNTRVSFKCYKRGQHITSYVFGYYRSNVWHKVTWMGKTGYVSDSYMKTGHNGPVPGEKLCNSRRAPAKRYTPRVTLSQVSGSSGKLRVKITRAKPNTTYRIVAYSKGGPYASANDWCPRVYIRTNSRGTGSNSSCYYRYWGNKLKVRVAGKSSSWVTWKRPAVPRRTAPPRAARIAQPPAVANPARPPATSPTAVPRPTATPRPNLRIDTSTAPLNAYAFCNFNPPRHALGGKVYNVKGAVYRDGVLCTATWYWVGSNGIGFGKISSKSSLDYACQWLAGSLSSYAGSGNCNWPYPGIVPVGTISGNYEFHCDHGLFQHWFRPIKTICRRW